ncbi:MAG: transcriptional regulator [Thalassobius sp.]|nr:transcriptional regulator [Thalassovita sp.]
MDIISPGSGLLIWPMLLACHVLLILVASFNLLKVKFTDANKLIWLVIILFAPIVGSILYFINHKKYKTVNH